MVVTSHIWVDRKGTALLLVIVGSKYMYIENYRLLGKVT